MIKWFRGAILCGLLLPLHAQEQAPAFPKAFTGYAEFETTAGFKQVGWASIVTAGQGGGAYIISARNLLGPGGGFPNQVAAENVASFVRSVQIDSLAGGVHGYIVSGLPITAPDIDPLQSPIDDLAIFQLHNASAQGPEVPLATQIPGKGETVWFISKSANGSELSALAGTVVTDVSNGWLTVKLKSGALDKNASGTAVLNGTGELVGVYSQADAKDASMLELIPSVTIAKMLPPGKDN